jgi:hypothetical protein
MQASSGASKPAAAAHLRPTDRLADLLQHPALQGFADQMMPRHWFWARVLPAPRPAVAR